MIYTEGCAYQAYYSEIAARTPAQAARAFYDLS